MLLPNNITRGHVKLWLYLICISFHSTAEALSNVQNQNMSDAFRNLFLPNGNAPLSGLFAQRPDLASILDAVADKGISEFYTGIIVKEMVAAVRITFCFDSLYSSIHQFCSELSYFYSPNTTSWNLYIFFNIILSFGNGVMIISYRNMEFIG